MTNSMIRYETTFEATQNLVKTIELGHGENADLYASITDCGVPVSLSGYTARAIYQPKSKWGTDNWYECPCEVSGNTVIAHWGNAYDNGENIVKLFMHLSKDGKVAYPAIYKIGLFQTPGFEPSPITPIPETLDFSQYTLLNAPWVLPDELSATEWGIVVHDSLSSLNESVMNLDLLKADADTVQDLADSLSAYATTESLSDYATTASLSAYATTDSLSAYATTDSLSAYATTASLSAYATKEALSAVDVLRGNVDTLSGNVNTLSGTVGTLSGNVNTLSTSTLKTSQLITSITSASTDLDVPTGKAVYDAIQEGGGGGGGATGYTVTFANDFAEKTNDLHQLLTAPVRFVKADGTSEVVDLHNVAALRGTSIQNVVMLDSGVWQKQSGQFGGIGFGDTYNFRDADAFIYGRGVWMTMNGIKVGLPAIAYGVEFGGALDSPWNCGQSSPMTQLYLTGDVTINYTRTGLVCLLKGTLIRLANGQDKPIEEITYDDDLLVWDFDEGKLSSAKPLWIKKPQIAPYYFRNILGNGRELLTTGKSKTGWGHRMFDLDKEMFRYTTESVADRIYTLDGIEIHKSCERIVKECEFYNIITEKHFNLFANGILTSCSLNNLYPISGMKFKKEDREFRPFEAYDVPLKYYKGLRLGEQNGDVNSLNEYVGRLVELERQ